MGETVSSMSCYLLLSLISMTVAMDCPTNYGQFQGRIGLYLPHADHRIQLGAGRRGMGAENEGHLVEIKNEEQQQHLAQLLPTVAEGVEMWWIGATDLYSEGFWYWVYSQEICTFTQWVEGQPSNTGGVEHCAALVTEDGYKWNDYVCTETIQRIAYSVCQINP